jgi:ribosome maturation factor RimP
MHGGEYMLDLKIVEELVKPCLEENNFELYNLEWANEFGYKILRVSIDTKGGINSDQLGIVNDYLSEKLDQYEAELPDNYMLEVCSPGAEKPLKTLDEVKEAVGEKIHVTMPDIEYEGKLLEVSEDETSLLQINVKGRLKKVSVLYNLAKEVRLAV